MAQSPNTAAIVVTVVDQTGAVVPEAAVSVTNVETGAVRTAVSASDGTAVVSALSLTGRYRVSVAKPGFTAEEIPDIRLRAGETARFEVRLVASGGTSTVTVYGTAEGVRTDPQLGMRLDARQVEETPLLGRKVMALPLLSASFRSAKGTGDLFLNTPLFVANGGGRRQTTVAIDGATSDDPWGRQTVFTAVPLAAVQEMTVLSNAFTPEFGWTTGSALNLVTKAGTNDRHGELLLATRPARLQSRRMSIDGTTVAPADVPDTLLQVSGAIGGPIAADRVHYFVAAEGTRQRRTAVITSPLRPFDEYVGTFEQALADGRLDYRAGAAHQVMARFNVDRFTDTNPNDTVSGTTLPSAARIFRRHTYAAQLNDTAVLSSTMLNEMRLAWHEGAPITFFGPVQPSTQFVRPGVATEGESRVADIFSRQVQLSDTLSWTLGRHDVRVGGSLAWAASGGNGQEFGSGFVLGQFQVNPAVTRPLGQLTLADVTRYTQSFGTSTYRADQWIAVLFVHDRFRVRSDLTVDAGLRYDRQTFSDGTRNVAPRLGAAWNPGGDPSTSVRGSAGVYYSQLRSNLEAGFALNGPEGVFTYTAAPGQPGFPTSLTAVPVSFPSDAVLPPRNITIRPGRASYYARFFDISRLPRYPDALVNPRSVVASIGIERRLGRSLAASVDYVRHHWTGIERTVDLNAPAPFRRTQPGQVRPAAAADATRPIPPVPNGFRQINAVINEGVSDYDGLQALVRHRGPRSFVSVSYTLAKATNTVEPDAPGGGPNDYNELGEAERGPSLLDQRHRLVLTAIGRLPYDVGVGMVAQFASARPYGAVTGVDNNGDGVLSDRPVIDGRVIGRNTFRGSATSDVTFFVEGRLPARRASVLVRAEVFNAFNHANVLGRQSVYGNGAAPAPGFGAPLAGLANIDPPRMAQFEVRVVF
ncbi:MAG TPA: TonB-dependent receptor [Vicinamibacterales bacterium]|nr:TonB-dependent receptor [Vicinamibacterales bacterium]